MPFFFAAGRIDPHRELGLQVEALALTDLAEAGGSPWNVSWSDERQYFSVAHLSPRHGERQDAPGQADRRGLLPATSHSGEPLSRNRECCPGRTTTPS